jgi:hypothetical protein
MRLSATVWHSLLASNSITSRPLCHICARILLHRRVRRSLCLEFYHTESVHIHPQQDIVWEKLADVSGDNAFCNSNFSVYHPSKESSGSRVQAPQAGASKGDDVSTNEPISLNDVQNVSSPILSLSAPSPPSLRLRLREHLRRRLCVCPCAVCRFCRSLHKLTIVLDSVLLLGYPFFFTRMLS